jgi:hypothetical protein
LLGLDTVIEAACDCISMAMLVFCSHCCPSGRTPGLSCTPSPMHAQFTPPLCCRSHVARGSHSAAPATTVPQSGSGRTSGKSDELSGGSNVELTMPMGTTSFGPAVAWTVRFIAAQPRMTTCASVERTLSSLPHGPASGGGGMPQSR